MLPRRSGPLACGVALAALATAAPARAQDAPRTITADEAGATSDPSWSPLDDDGWPRGVSLERMRGLRPCAPGERLPGPGERIPCRPPVYPESPQWALSVDWTSGLIDGDIPTTGGAHALGVELDFAVARALQLGVRYELMGIGLLDVDPDSLDVGVGHRLFGLARYRLFTDEVDRDAFTLGVGAGYALQEDELGGSAPVARAAFGREIGLYLDDENALTMGLELAYAHTFGDDPYDAVLASARFGFEISIREPLNLDTVDDPPSKRYYAGADIYAGPFVGLGYTLGLRLGRYLSVPTTASFIFGLTDVGKQSGLDGSQWAVQSGLRLLGPWPGPAPLYLQLQAGPGWVSHDPEREIALLADLETGVELFASCEGAIDLGLRLRANVEDGVDVLSGSMVLRMAFGGGRVRGYRGRCVPAGPPSPYMPTPPPPPPVAQPQPQPTPAGPDTSGGAAIEGGGAVEVEGGAGVEVDVEVAKPEPIVVEVELGAVLLGGLVEVRVDPRLLPLARLRNAGYIELELVGPDRALLDYEASLRGVLGRENIYIDAWARTQTDSRVVRARFTIWPPGSKP